MAVMAVPMFTPDMARFSASAQLRKAHCLTEGQLTPPSSPEEQKELLVRHGSRFNFSKLLRKTKSVKLNTKVPVQAPLDIDPSSVSQPLTSSISPHALPPSPADSNGSSHPSTPLELRRVRSSYEDLRGLAIQQSVEPLRRPSPLLPSPIIHSTSAYSPELGEGGKTPLKDQDDTYKSYEDLHILSCYLEESPQTAHCIRRYLRRSQDQVFDEDSENTEDCNLATWEASYLTPTQEEQRSTTCSSEAGWLANATSQRQRRRRLNTRCYQVVEHPPWNGSSNNNEDCGHQILLATVLVGPGKPKLVQIQRPSSSRSGSSSRSNPNHDQRPRTPTSEAIERSAFSPDTPSDALQDTNITSFLGYSHDRSNWSKLSLVPAPLVIPTEPHQSRDSSHSTIFSSTARRLRTLADPFGSSQSAYDQNASPQSYPGAKPWPMPPRQDSFPCRASSIASVPSPTETPMMFSQRRKLHRMLDTVIKAIESFPNGMLRLESPIVVSLRNKTVPDETHLACLSKVFPKVHKLLLSALAAWIVLDLYLFNLTKKQRPDPSRTTSAGSDMRYIPEKAREMLGIGSLTMADVVMNDESLLKRVQIVRISVGVVAQRLMAALRGSWDEDLWNSLMVLIDIVERGAGNGGWV